MSLQAMRQEGLLPQLSMFGSLDDCVNVDAEVAAIPQQVCCTCVTGVRKSSNVPIDSGEVCTHPGCAGPVDACCIACRAALCIQHMWMDPTSCCHEHSIGKRCPCKSCKTLCPDCGHVLKPAILALSSERVFGRCVWIPGALHMLHGADPLQAHV